MNDDANCFVFRVWDELNGEREDAQRIEAGGPSDAAEIYASDDRDGWNFRAFLEAL